MRIQYTAGDGVTPIPVSEDNPLPVSGGGGGGGGSVTVTNFPATQPVSGTVAVTGALTNAQFASAIGTPSDEPWSGSGNATVISLLKAIVPILNLTATEVSEIDQDMDVVKSLLDDIKTNTTPSP